jgi:hypothetical protein
VAVARARRLAHQSTGRDARATSFSGSIQGGDARATSFFRINHGLGGMGTRIRTKTGCQCQDFALDSLITAIFRVRNIFETIYAYDCCDGLL